MNRSDLPDTPPRTVCLSQRCFVVLAAIAVLGFAKQMAFEESIRHSTVDGVLIRAVGSLPTLSQRIAKAALAQTESHQHQDGSGHVEWTGRLLNALEELKESHHAVRHRDPEAGLGGEYSDSVQRCLESLDETYGFVIKRGEQIAAIEYSSIVAKDESMAATSDFDQLLKATDDYSQGISRICVSLAEEARLHVIELRNLSRLGLLATMLLLIGVAIFVLAPAIHSTKAEHQKLLEASLVIKMEQAAGDVLNESLRSSLSLNQAVFGTAADAVIVLDEVGVIEQANESVQEIFGYDTNELIGLNVTLLMSDSDAQGHGESLMMATNSGRHGVLLRNHHVSAVRADGSSFPAELSVSRAVVGERTIFTGIVRDVSDRELLQRSLSQARKMESVGQLASGISHEINSPMQFIANNVSYMKRHIGDLLKIVDQFSDTSNRGAAEKGASHPEKVSNGSALCEDFGAALDDCELGVDRVVEIVTAMKDFAHPGGEERSLICVNSILRNAATITRNRTKQVATVDLNLTDCPRILADPSGLSQTFVNLLVNAADAIEEATSPDGQLGQITLTTECLDDGILIRVSDTGCGMPDHVAQRIFDPFYTTKDIGRGSGQGLAIAYNAIVDQHSGKISVDTAPGQGTAFRVFLPLQTESHRSKASDTRPLEEGKSLA